MAVDLKSNTMFQRVSLILMPDCLIKLEHERTQDRVRRFSYETIQSVIFWQTLPWVRLILCTVCLVLPGIALQFVQETASTVTGLFLIVLGGARIGWYFYCKVTTIRIVRGGKVNDMKGLFRPGKMRRFRERLIAGIQASQIAPAPNTFAQAAVDRLNQVVQTNDDLSPLDRLAPIPLDVDNIIQ